jgi:hemoglobin
MTDSSNVGTPPTIFDNYEKTIHACKTVASFNINTFLENIVLDEYDNIYVTSVEEGIIYKVAPSGMVITHAAITGKPAGIVYLGMGRLLFNGWNEDNIPALFIADEQGRTTEVHQIKDAAFLNGMIAINEDTVIICDAIVGKLFRYNIHTNTSDVWLEHDLLKKITDNPYMPAANGIKKYQDQLFISNTDKKLLLTISVVNDEPGELQTWLSNINIDDFAIDDQGNIYATTHIYNSVIKITPDKNISVIASEAQGLAGSTAAAFGISPNSSGILYVTTNGGMSLPPAGGIQPARIVHINLRSYEYKEIPSPCSWAGGVDTFERLTAVFYEKVLQDELLEPVFRHMSKEHSKHVAHFMAETLKGPKLYTQEYGSGALKHMVGKHIGKQLTEQQRKRWAELLMISADEVGLAADPEFRSTFVAHIEWGSRVAVINSQLTENPTTDNHQIPEWGWGEVKGPFEVVGSLFEKPHDDNDHKRENTSSN